VTESDNIDFSAPAVLEDRVSQYDFTGDGITVLVFFPGAFTKVCTEEIIGFRDMKDELEEDDIEVVGVSVDTASTLEKFRDRFDINFTLVSDHTRSVVEQYDVQTKFQDLGVTGLAKRALIVIEDSEIVYREILENPNELPDMDELRKQLEELT
jgi:peroxiredoxin